MDSTVSNNINSNDDVHSDADITTATSVMSPHGISHVTHTVRRRPIKLGAESKCIPDDNKNKETWDKPHSSSETRRIQEK